MSTFTPRRVGHTHTFHLPGTPEQLFPLFTPEGERKWAAGWDFAPIYPAGDIEENMIFTTASHDHSQSVAIWIVTRYEPTQYFVEYQRIEPGEKVGRIRVHCEAENDQTRVTVEYVYTALSEAGNAFLEGFTASHYIHFIHAWETAIRRFLHTNLLLPHA